MFAVYGPDVGDYKNMLVKIFYSNFHFWKSQNWFYTY